MSSSSEPKFQDIIVQCDGLIKAGQIGAVNEIISALNFASVPREYRQSFAKICRRAGLIAQGLRLLHPVVRSEKGASEAASESEICEYSVLLSRNGSIPEALGLLKSVDPTRNPEALLYTGYCHISNWEYAKSVSYLEQFLNSPADDYAKLIARVNLVASYVVTSKLDEASALLTETIAIAEKAGATRLVGNCFELWGQVYFWRGDFKNARQALKKALDIFGNTQSYDQLLVNKTESIMQALETRSVDPLLKFKNEATERKHRESVREADLFLLKVQFDQKHMDHLIFGTPMTPYRERIQQVLQASPSDTYVYGKSGHRFLDLHSGKLADKDGLNAGKKIHQVLASLMRDYYVPRNIGTLFSELYPDEYFDVNSSPFRVRQLMLRTRQWLKAQKIPASILHTENTYALSIHGNFGILVTLDAGPVASFHLHLESLESAFPNQRRFTAAQACEVLKCSRTQFRRWADWALSEGKVTKSGVNKATRYTLASRSINLPNQTTTPPAKAA